jgi:La-related protein 7
MGVSIPAVLSDIWKLSEFLHCSILGYQLACLLVEQVVSDDGKKVRRVQPLPDVDLEEVQTRTVVAENLPEDHSIESVEQLFGSVGNVKMVRICQPDAANGANQTAAKFKSDMVVSNKLHALVEFETVEQAEKAVVALTDKGNWRSGLRVRLLLRRTFHPKHGPQKGRKTGEESEEDEATAEDHGWEDHHQHYDHGEDAQVCIAVLVMSVL